MIFLARQLDQGVWGDLRTIEAFRTAFMLSSLVYVILVASLVVVLVGTILYFIDITRMAKDVGQHGNQVYLALGLLVTVLVIVIVAILSENFVIGSPSIEDFCNGRDLTRNFFYHDTIVFILFAGFTGVDFLTVRGLDEALLKLSPRKRAGKEGRKLRASREWALAQLKLIDVPVAVGAFALFGLVHYIESREIMMIFVSPIQMPPVTGGVYSAHESMTQLQCLKLPLQDLQRFIGNTFIAGVAAGSLAAHVLMSQFIFMMLSLFFRRPPASVTLAKLRPPKSSGFDAKLAD
jgi:hypothetical protein